MSNFTKTGDVGICTAMVDIEVQGKGGGGCFGGSKPAPEPPIVLCPVSAKPVAGQPPKSVVIIYNPYGGNKSGERIYNEVRPLFEAAGVSVDARQTEYSGHATDLAKEISLENVDAICTIGGDGTVHQTLTGLMIRSDGKRVPIGIIPGGTGNSFIRTLGAAYGTTPADAVRHILSGFVCTADCAKVDVTDAKEAGRTNTFYSMNVVLRDTTARNAEAWRWMGKARYDVAIVWDILKHNVPCSTITMDGEKIASGIFARLYTRLAPLALPPREAEMQSDNTTIACSQAISSPT